MPKHRSEEQYKNIPVAFKVVKSTAVSIISKWKKFGTINGLPAAVLAAKLGNKR